MLWICILSDVKKGKLKMTYIVSHRPCTPFMYMIYTYIHTCGRWTLKKVILVRSLDKR